jgi:hypothetical protein
MFDGTLLNAGVVSHELGHNFGLRHSHALNCGTDVLGDNCTAYEYGDRLDRMGNPDKGHFNAVQKARLGWLGYQASPPIVTADSTGIYQLEPFAPQTQGTKAIRILRDVDPVTGQRRWFYLESRQALGFDSFLATSNDGDSATNGLTFRTGVEGDPDSSYLLDMTPNSQAYDWLDFALPLGISFTDAASGATIALEQVGTSGATVSVNFGQPQCIRANPGLSASPLQGPWVQPGTPVSFDVTVTNNDSSACPEATLALAGTVPDGWQSDIETPAFTLAPGANATTRLTVTSLTTAADGFYPVEVMAVDQSNASYTATDTVTYVVATTDQPPVAVDDSETTLAETPVTINVLSNDSDPDGDPLTVIAIDQPSNGSIQFNASGNVTYVPAPGFNGTEAFAYTISDGQAIASAMVAINVKKGRGAKGGKGGGNGKGPK